MDGKFIHRSGFRDPLSARARIEHLLFRRDDGNELPDFGQKFFRFRKDRLVTHLEADAEQAFFLLCEFHELLPLRDIRCQRLLGKHVETALQQRLDNRIMRLRRRHDADRIQIGRQLRDIRERLRAADIRQGFRLCGVQIHSRCDFNSIDGAPGTCMSHSDSTASDDSDFEHDFLLISVLISFFSDSKCCRASHLSKHFPLRLQ